MLNSFFPVVHRHTQSGETPIFLLNSGGVMPDDCKAFLSCGYTTVLNGTWFVFSLIFLHLSEQRPDGHAQCFGNVLIRRHVADASSLSEV